jgi:hypothetical protein
MISELHKRQLLLAIEKYWLLENAKPHIRPLDLSKINETTEIKVVLDESNEIKTRNLLKLFTKSDLDLTPQSNIMNRFVKSMDDDSKRLYEYNEDAKKLLQLLIDKNNEEYTKFVKHTMDLANSYIPKIMNDPNKSDIIQLYRPILSPHKESEIEERVPLTKESNTKEQIVKVPIVKELVFIKKKVSCLKDLIDMCDEFPEAETIEYNINMSSIHKIRPHLEELQALVGMHSLKENMVDQILYYVQGFHKMNASQDVPNDYMHTVIYGPPGTGKTEVAKIMGKIFANLGVLKSGVFKKVTREDLIAGYLGQTATKTKEVLKSCKGGVLFIDEAYALGNSEKRDSFSKESIDTICEALSDMRGEFMCIIAGYEKELKECFFSYNEGLESRFTWRFKIEEYKSSEMNMIFNKKVEDLGWKLKDHDNDKWFDKNMEYFKYFGRDMETLLSKTKIAHSRRVFCLPVEEKGFLLGEDLENGMIMFLKNDDVVKRREEQNRIKQLYNTMYS